MVTSGRTAPTRRKFLRGGAAAAAVLAGGATGSGLARASATPQHGVTVVTFTPQNLWYTGETYWERFLQPAIGHFEAKHPGVRMQIVTGTGGGSFLESMIAGVGPDVIQDWVFPPYLDAHALLDVGPYIKQDNISLATWSPGQIRAMHTPEGTFFLPAYINTVTTVVNLGDLDTLGLAYPEDNWTYLDAERLFRAATFQRHGQHHYGANLFFQGNTLGSAGSDTANYAVHGFGGSVMDPSATRCLMDDPRVAEAVQWYDQLYWDKVAGGPFDLNQSTFMEATSGNMAVNLAAWGNKYKWTFLPVPMWPAGRFTFEATDFWAINAATKHPDAAWEVMKFLTADPWYAKYQIQYTLLPPSMLSLLPDYVDFVEGVAPVARHRGLKWFVEAASHWGVASRTFKYLDYEAMNVIDRGLQSAFDRRQDVTSAMHTATQQVNALEATGPTLQATVAADQSRNQALFARARASAAAIQYPAPAARTPFPGSAPTPGNALVTAGAHGVYTLRATGGGGLTGFSDNGTFACGPFRQSRGAVTCRLMAVAAPKGGALAAGAKIGLLARDSLSDNAAEVGVEFAVDRGVHAHVRALDGSGYLDEHSGLGGLLPQASIQTASTPPAGGNWLLHPLWLRLVLKVNTWTAYTSLDGTHWAQAGNPAVVEFAGAWVGLFATSHQSGQTVQAAFDHISGFTPARFYQLGQP